MADKEYLFLYSDSVEDLQEQVNQKADEGYQVSGDVVFTGYNKREYCFLQAMTK